MVTELETLENAIRSIWKVIGKEVVMTKEYYSSTESGQRVTLLLLTDQEIEHLCQGYAETLRQIRWLIDVAGYSPSSWSVDRNLVYKRLDHFAEVLSVEKVKCILDNVFEGYDPDEACAEYEARQRGEWSRLAPLPPTKMLLFSSQDSSSTELA